ncbi:MAG TPA: hypothetical protein VG371_16985 [Solirubrobacteraceae bacterium]|jgi:hypothetical protein|nr:hypothetical protein [Solirubrobacteraceae bacterium]
MAKNDKTAVKKDKKAKTKGTKKVKKGKGAAADGISVAGHPRAAAQVRRAKGLGGIISFAIAAYLSYKAGVPSDQIALRALAVGLAGYMLAWACSVTVWRHLVLAELRAAVESGRARLETMPRVPAAATGEADQPDGSGG